MSINFNRFKKKEESTHVDQDTTKQTPVIPSQQQQQQQDKTYGGSIWEEKESPSKVVVSQSAQQRGKPNFLKKELPPAVPVKQVLDEVPEKSDSIQTQSNEKKVEAPKDSINKNLPISKQFKPQNELDLLSPDQLENPLMQNSTNQLFAVDQFENKSVDEIIAPGGMRVKQTQTTLDEFCQTANNCQTPVIGSILISKLHSELSFQQKMRALFAIQELIRKIEKYQQYFKHHLSVIQASPAPSNDPQGSFQQELRQIAILVSNPGAILNQNETDVKFEFKNNLLSTVASTQPHLKQEIPVEKPQKQEQNQKESHISQIQNVDSSPKKKGFDFIKKNQPQQTADEVHSSIQQAPSSIQESQQAVKKTNAFSFLKKNQNNNSDQDKEKVDISSEKTNLLGTPDDHINQIQSINQQLDTFSLSNAIINYPNQNNSNINPNSFMSPSQNMNNQQYPQPHLAQQFYPPHPSFQSYQQNPNAYYNSYYPQQQAYPVQYPPQPQLYGYPTPYPLPPGQQYSYPSPYPQQQTGYAPYPIEQKFEVPREIISQNKPDKREEAFNFIKI